MVMEARQMIASLPAPTADIQTEVIEQAKVLSLVGQISLNLRGVSRRAMGDIFICVCHGERCRVCSEKVSTG